MYSIKLAPKVVLALATCVCFAMSAFGQDSLSVDTKEAAGSGVQNAKIVTLWIPKTDEVSGAEIREKQLQLVFSTSSSDFRSGVLLKAFAADGSIIGQSMWCGRTVSASLSSSVANGSTARNASEATYSLNLDPSLVNAARYSMSVVPPVSNLEPGPGPETCAECAQVAGAVCGSRGIKSMTCGGTSGTCTFTCNGN